MTDATKSIARQTWEAVRDRCISTDDPVPIIQGFLDACADEKIEECAKIAEEAICESCFIEYGYKKGSEDYDHDEVPDKIRQLKSKKEPSK